MGDVPSATLAVLEVLLLLRAGGRGSVAAAGIIGAALVWIRPTNAILLLAGMAALTAQPQLRRRLIAYVAGATPLLGLLALWQTHLFGSPFATGYQITGATPNGDTMLGAFFRPAISWVCPRPLAMSSSAGNSRTYSIIRSPLRG